MLIGSRDFLISDPSGKVSVPVRLFVPEETEDGFACRYQIDWPDGQTSRRALAPDALRALVRALDAVAREVDNSRRQRRVEIIWGFRGMSSGLRPRHSLRTLMKDHLKNA